MREKSAERRVAAWEPARRVGASLTRTMTFPPAANDNGPPLLFRLAVMAGAAGVLTGAAALFRLLG